MSIGNNIKEKRKLNNLTQEELASKCGLSKNGLWNYENNKRTPNTEVLIKIAKILDVSLMDLIYDDNVKHEKNQIEKLKAEIPESEKRLMNESPSMQKYNDDNFKGEYILDELLKNIVLQKDSNYDYETLMFNVGIDNIYIFIQKILQMKYSNNVAANNEDIAIELILNFYGSSSNKFTKDENKIIKDTILNYIKGMIEFKRMNK